MEMDAGFRKEFRPDSRSISLWISVIGQSAMIHEWRHGIFNQLCSGPIHADFT